MADTDLSSRSPIAINVAAQAPLKLTSDNYCAWRLQFHSCLIGYDLLGYVDGSISCPPIAAPPATGASATVVAAAASASAKRSFWIRQDQLLLNAIVGSLSPSLIPFITSASTAHEAWETLITMYGRPSRGRIMQLRSALDSLAKGSKTISEYMLSVKISVDELRMLNVPCDDDDLTLKILNGLGEEYQGIGDAIKARETSISFAELLEKLQVRESQLGLLSRSISYPASANPAMTASSYSPPMPPTNYHQQSPSHGRFSHAPSPKHSKPRHPRGTYKGFCQLCGEQGHSAKRCMSFRYVSIHDNDTRHPPQAHFAATPAQPPLLPTPTQTPAWLLDSGASHHITNDLNNLSLHTPYSGTDGVHIGDGSQEWVNPNERQG